MPFFLQTRDSNKWRGILRRRRPGSEPPRHDAVTAGDTACGNCASKGVLHPLLGHTKVGAAKDCSSFLMQFCLLWTGCSEAGNGQKDRRSKRPVCVREKQEKRAGNRSSATCMNSVRHWAALTCYLKTGPELVLVWCSALKAAGARAA